MSLPVTQYQRSRHARGISDLGRWTMRSCLERLVLSVLLPPASRRTYQHSPTASLVLGPERSGSEPAFPLMPLVRAEREEEVTGRRSPVFCGWTPSLGGAAAPVRGGSGANRNRVEQRADGSAFGFGREKSN